MRAQHTTFVIANYELTCKKGKRTWVKTCFEKSSPASLKAFCTSSRPFRVSGVPPLCTYKQACDANKYLIAMGKRGIIRKYRNYICTLEITITRVDLSSSPSWAIWWSIPAGSVLSINCIWYPAEKRVMLIVLETHINTQNEKMNGLDCINLQRPRRTWPC